MATIVSGGVGQVVEKGASGICDELSTFDRFCAYHLPVCGPSWSSWNKCRSAWSRLTAGARERSRRPRGGGMVRPHRFDSTSLGRGRQMREQGGIAERSRINEHHAKFHSRITSFQNDAIDK
jgi:hypothetical protein